jgi:hypothetical protein
VNATPSSRADLPAPATSLYGLYLLAVAAALVGNLLVRLGDRAGWLPRWGQIAVGVLAVVPLGIAAARFWRLLRHDLDELMQRVVLEGMAFALTLYVPLAALYVNLRTAGAWTPRLDPPDILLAPAILVAVGIAVAWRRYQ